MPQLQSYNRVCPMSLRAHGDATTRQTLVAVCFTM